MCKSCEYFVDKVGTTLAKIYAILLDKLSPRVNVWKSNLSPTDFYQRFSQDIFSSQLRHSAQLSTLSTPLTATIKLKKGIE
jgi:hypothetical protein